MSENSSKRPSRNAEMESYIQRFAPYAMEQQQKYGIPASVTLSQMVNETGVNTGRAIREGNNAFCVKGTYHGDYILISDDAKDEKFRKYPSLAVSFEDHSRVLMGKHYAHCRAYGDMDYRSWCIGLQSGESTGGRYATSPAYTQKLLSTIEQYDLTKYDRMAHADAVAKGVRIGYMRDSSSSASAVRGYSFPVAATSGQMVVTSDFGHRHSPKAGASSNHQGIDIRARQPVDVYATENGGKVVEAKPMGNRHPNGNYVTVEYDRPDGTKYRTMYLHLSSISVKEGDVVKAGQVLGKTGNSSSIGGIAPHLHFHVKQPDAQGRWTAIDPKIYLADIAVRGGIDTKTVLKGGKGEDLLADLKTQVHVDDAVATSSDMDLAQAQEVVSDRQESSADVLSPEDERKTLSELTHSNDPSKWMQYLVRQAGESGIGGSGDLISDVISALISGLTSLAALSSLDEEVADESKSQSVQETVKEREERILHRDKESVNASRAASMASVNFDAGYPEQNEGQRHGVHLS